MCIRDSRKLLQGLLVAFGWEPELHGAVLHEIDRLGKIDDAEVITRIRAIKPEVNDVSGGPERLVQLLRACDGGPTTFALLEPYEQTATVLEGMTELRRVYEGTLALGVPASQLKIDLSIARGLDYYTGTVYETFLDEHPKLGSICSGGRYENLAGHYTKSKLPGVGISIGATRLFSQLLEMNVIGADTAGVAQVLVLTVDGTLTADYARMATELRTRGLNVEVYGGEDKLGKQLKYADRAKVPLAVIYGSRERDAGIVKVKDLRGGGEAKEHELPRADLVTGIQRLLG